MRQRPSGGQHQRPAAAPSRAEQLKAVERARRDQRHAAQLQRDREVQEPSVTVTQTVLRPAPVAHTLRTSGTDTTIALADTGIASSVAPSTFKTTEYVFVTPRVT